MVMARTSQQPFARSEQLNGPPDPLIDAVPVGTKVYHHPGNAGCPAPIFQNVNVLPPDADENCQPATALNVDYLNQMPLDGLCTYCENLRTALRTPCYGQIDLAGIQQCVGNEIRDGRRCSGFAVPDVTSFVREVMLTNLSFLRHELGLALAS